MSLSYRPHSSTQMLGDYFRYEVCRLIAKATPVHPLFFAVGSILGNPCTRLPRDHPPSGLECSVTKGISRELTGHNGHAWVDLLDGLDKPTATFPSFV